MLRLCVARKCSILVAGILGASLCAAPAMAQSGSCARLPLTQDPTVTVGGSDAGGCPPGFVRVIEYPENNTESDRTSSNIVQTRPPEGSES